VYLGTQFQREEKKAIAFISRGRGRPSNSVRPSCRGEKKRFPSDLQLKKRKKTQRTHHEIKREKKKGSLIDSTKKTVSARKKKKGLPALDLQEREGEAGRLVFRRSGKKRKKRRQCTT